MYKLQATVSSPRLNLHPARAMRAFFMSKKYFSTTVYIVNQQWLNVYTVAQ
jgi:hypothetical protein